VTQQPVLAVLFVVLSEDGGNRHCSRWLVPVFVILTAYLIGRVLIQPIIRSGSGGFLILTPIWMGRSKLLLPGGVVLIRWLLSGQPQERRERSGSHRIKECQLVRHDDLSFSAGAIARQKGINKRSSHSKHWFKQC